MLVWLTVTEIVRLTYVFTAWEIILLQKQTVSKLDKNSPQYSIPVFVKPAASCDVTPYDLLEGDSYLYS
jgi:hypothetical protein